MKRRDYLFSATIAVAGTHLAESATGSASSVITPKRAATVVDDRQSNRDA